MTEDDEGNHRWPAARIAVLVLTVAVALLAVNAWRTQPADHRTLYLICIGMVLGALYTIRGKSLPSLVHRIAGPRLTADDDSRNLSSKIYLPVLLFVIFVAALICYFYVPR